MLLAASAALMQSVSAAALDWLADVARFELGLAGYLALFAVFFLTLERRWPAVPRQRRWRRGTRTDLLLSLLNPVVVQPASAYLTAVVVSAVLLATGPRFVDAQRAAMAAQPMWVQFLAATILADFVAYWKHRLFHLSWLWPFHAVHHSATEVDWLTNDRDHPVQLLGTYLIGSVALVLAGVSPEMIGTQALLRRFYSLYTHANLRWSYGPLNRIFVSPAVHRWHHSTDARLAGKNFAVMFSLFDIMFGTYCLPQGEQPAAFGLPDREAREGFLAALGHPLVYVSGPR
jgi:sterol desaturase/sphingolipid hydroxylase (fatty acid hydroxylase superfamily)